MATTTLTGTTGNNLLNAPGSVSTLVQGLQGADTITLALVNDEAQGGKGSDIITLTATGTVVSTVAGGDGNDTVNFSGASQFSGFVNLGSGNDSIAIAAAAPLNNAQIYGDAGNDSIVLANSLVNSTVGGGLDRDVISFTAGGGQTITSSLVHGGKNQDTITIAGGTTGSFGTIIAGQGLDIVSVTGAGTFTNSLIGGGQGNDSIRASTAFGSVAGGGLDDTIVLVGGFAGGRVYGDAVGITSAGTGTGGAADGNDSIQLAAAATAATSIYGAGGNDTINIASGGANLTLVNGGDGSDSIYYAGSAAGIAGFASFGTINGGAGNDTITLGTQVGSVSAYSAAGVIVGGDGSDLVIVGATAGSLLAGAYSASNVTALTAVGFVIAGAGAGDVIRIGNNSAITSATAANWAVGAPTIFVASSLSSLSAAMLANFGSTANSGSIGVFSDGNDTVISISDGDGTSVFTIVVDGLDLVATSLFGQAVTLTSSNFGFAVSAAGSAGLNITFS